MFHNIGGKCKALAAITCWLGIVASIIGAITFWPNMGIGFGVLIGGTLGSWIGSWALYAIGEAADSANEIVGLRAEIEQLQKQVDAVALIKSPECQSLPCKSSSVDLAMPCDPARIDIEERETPVHKWRCIDCGQMISSSPCPHCNQ